VTPKAPRTFTGRQVLAVAVAVGVIAFGIGAAVDNGGGTSSGTPKAADSASQSAPTTTEVEVTTTAASTYNTPEPSDFELTMKTLSKQCFGSAFVRGKLTARVVSVEEQ
jgi:hypothetical protein